MDLNVKLDTLLLQWDTKLHKQVGVSTCGNGNLGPCPWHGFFRHAGKRFSPFVNNNINRGMPITARGDIAGPTGGYGWILNFNRTSPRTINFTEIIVHPNSPLFISIPYPIGTKFEITAVASSCWDDDEYVCNFKFTKVNTINKVYTGTGSQYYVDSNGVITFRVAQTVNGYAGNKTTLVIPNYKTLPRQYQEYNLWGMERFERNNILLPQSHWGAMYTLHAQCPNDIDNTKRRGYCTEPVQRNYDPDVCPPGYVQVAYDKCCNSNNSNDCITA
jgi:hypothetical protein